MSQQATATTPTVGTPNMHGYTVVDPGRGYDYVVVLTPRVDEDDYPHVIVDDDLAQFRDETLADLVRQEEALGDLRGAERGDFPQVDALYQRLNDRLTNTKTVIAREAVALLDGIVEGDVGRAAGLAGFSVLAGCKACPCTPGVILGARLYLGYRDVNVLVRRRPKPSRIRLTDAQYALLVAAYRGHVVRDEKTMAYTIRRDATAMPVDEGDLTFLYGHRLVDLATPPFASDDRQVQLTDKGFREVDARQYKV